MNILVSILLFLLLSYFKLHYEHYYEVCALFFKLLLDKCYGFLILWTFLAIVFLKLNLDFCALDVFWNGWWDWYLALFFLHKWVFYSWLDSVNAITLLCYCNLVCGSANLFWGIQILSFAGLWVMLLWYPCFCHIISVFSH